MIYTIPTYKLKATVKKLGELNGRLHGEKGSCVVWSVSPSYNTTVYDTKDGIIRSYLVEVVDINVENPIVSLNGWSFLAIIEHSKVGNVIMKKLYDVEVPEKYLTSGTYCEHCATKRYRKYTYLVYKKDTNEIHQVGSTCLTAYLGFDASLLLSHATIFNSMFSMMDTEHDKMVHRGLVTQNIDLFVKRAIVYIDKFGYVSSKKAREDAEKNKYSPDYNYLTATGYSVWELEYCNDKDFQKDIDNETKQEYITDKYNEIIDWVKNLEKGSDYINNIKVIIDRGYVTNKTATTAASIVGVWYANTHKKNVENKKISNHFGVIKERINVDMVLIRKSTFEGQYGVSNCYMFETIEGNVAAWFTASANLNEGTRYVGKATIAKHTEYKGVQQTLLNRCKLTEMV